MTKRKTGIGKDKKSHSHKTKKRLAAKRLMLEAKVNKKNINKAFRCFLINSLAQAMELLQEY